MSAGGRKIHNFSSILQSKGFCCFTAGIQLGQYLSMSPLHVSVSSDNVTATASLVLVVLGNGTRKGMGICYEEEGKELWPDAHLVLTFLTCNYLQF